MQCAVILLCGIHLSYAATHSLQYVHTAVSGGINFPEFTTFGLVDNVQFTYFDSNIMKEVPKTEWIRQNEGADYWDRQTQISIGTHQVYKNNIQVAKERFNQSTGVHTFQNMYGCEWDDETGATNGFWQYGYDGEDLLSLKLKDQTWISPVPQGLITTQKLNKDKALTDYWNQYLNTECIDWVKKYLQFGKSSLEKTVSPQVSLLQKDSSSPVTCHATGFYPSGVTITWMKNGQEHHEDVELGELLPNEDGTFQKASTLTVTPDEWKNNKFRCLVEHKGINREEREIRTNNGNSLPIGIIVGVVAAVVLLVGMAGIGYKIYQKEKGFKPVSGSDDGSNSSKEALCSKSSAPA